MTPLEKAETALNSRIERLQTNLNNSTSEAARAFLLQSLVVCVGLGEALAGYVKAVQAYANIRYSEIKEMQAKLTAEHAALLTSGNDLLERLRANPTDRDVLKQIEQAKKDMAAIQKTLRRGADSLQRELAPSMGIMDKLALSIRRFAEADGIDALKRTGKTVFEHVRELYSEQPRLDSRTIIDQAALERAALAEIDQGTDLYDSFARTGYHTMLAIDLMTLAVSETPPRTMDEACERAREASNTRVNTIAARLSAA